MLSTDIQKLLHHRPPYLMLDKVLELNSDSIKAQKTHVLTEGHIAGHFPGAPVVPGAMLQEMCTQAAGVLITKYHSPVANYNSGTTKGWALGVLNKVEYAKYLSIVKPNIPVQVEVRLIERLDQLFKFKANVLQNNEVKAKLKFNLMNISDSFLLS